MSESVEPQGFRIPSWLKIITGVSVVGLMAWKLPLLEIFQLFVTIVMIPVVFLSSLGLLSSGLIEGASDGVSRGFFRKFNEHRETIRNSLLNDEEPIERTDPAIKIAPRQTIPPKRKQNRGSVEYENMEASA